MQDNIKWSELYYITGVQSGERAGKKNIFRDKIVKKIHRFGKKKKSTKFSNPKAEYIYVTKNHT